MRSKASHFVGLFKFIIFLIAVILLVFVVVHWARQRQYTPQSTSGDRASKVILEKESNKDLSRNNKSEIKKSDNGKPSVDKDKSNQGASKKSVNSGVVKNSQKNQPDNGSMKSSASSKSATNSHVSTGTVPKTGLDAPHAIIGAIGSVVSVFTVYLFTYSRRWQKL